MKPFHVIIPARFGSSRLPGKPLLDMGGKTMIERVVEIANQSGATSVTVATDDVRIQQAVLEFGGKAVLTADTHESGTDRVAETCVSLGLPDDAVVVNLQGDEPLMPPQLLTQVAALLQENTGVAMATLCTPLKNAAEFVDPAVVKVVCAADNMALYFSRAPIPWTRDDGDSELVEGAWQEARRHLGIYAYSSGFVQQFAGMSASRLEQLERLEQLRVLSNGRRIACAEALQTPPAGVDNAEDLERARAFFASG